MYNEMLDKVSGAAKKKIGVLQESIWKYLVSSSFAGAYIGIGILLIFSIGGYMAGAPSTKILMGVAFAIALSLVIFTGTDLFTGNTFVMTVGSLTKATKWSDTVKIWIASYAGNLIGAIILSIIFVNSGLVDQGPVMEFFQTAAVAKASGSFLALFCRGILCNLLVCLAVMIGFRTTDDTAKLLITFMCLFAFITSGFEHSIANMTVYGVSLLAPHIEGVTVAQALHNLIPVTLGNMVGGGLILGGGAYVLRNKEYLK